jgi:hypothetical protein
MPKVICGCGNSVETKPEWAGQWISCPGCNGTLYAPFPGDKVAPPIPVIETAAPPPAAPAPVQTRLCPWCAETIAVSAMTCPICKGDATAKPTRVPSLIPPAPQSLQDNGGMAPLVVGILGFLFCQLISPVAWALGSRYEKDCAARGMIPSGAGKAGKILGIVGSCFLILMLVFMVFSVVVGAATS